MSPKLTGQAGEEFLYDTLKEKPDGRSGEEPDNKSLRHTI